MKSTLDTFRHLHQQEEPLLIGNAWNAQSTKVLEKAGVQAIATSSAAVAETMGYADGEQMSFEEYLFAIKRIVAVTNLPVSVDLEAGYGNTVEEIVTNIQQLIRIGVVGINIEDSMVSNGKRSILPAEAFAKKLTDVKKALDDLSLKVFINVRSDVFLLGLPDPADEALKRIEQYQPAGIDGIFLPCITNAEDIKAAVEATTLPVNVMCMPGLPDFEALKKLGVKRISMGNFVNKSVYDKMQNMCDLIVKQGSFASLF